CYVAASEPVDLNAGSKRLTPFLAQCLALARRQRFEKILVGFVAFIEEVELLVLAQQKILCLKGGDVFFGGEGDMGGGYAQLVRKRFQAARKCAADRLRVKATADQQARAGGRCERNGHLELRVIVPARALVGVCPAMVENIFALAMGFQISHDRAEQAPILIGQTQVLTQPSGSACRASAFL